MSALECAMKELDIKPGYKVVVHLRGMLAQIERIKEITDRYNLYLIEDCAQAFSSGKSGKPAGSFGGCRMFKLSSA